MVNAADAADTRCTMTKLCEKSRGFMSMCSHCKYQHCLQIGMKKGIALVISQSKNTDYTCRTSS